MEGLVKASVISAAKVTKLKVENSELADVFIGDMCQKQNITISELRGKSRKADLVLVRHLIAHSLRERFKLSYPEIGKKLNRDHSTIIHAHDRITSLIQEKSPSAQ